jgi:predicted enzyme related to lactoylglutathione lyase
VVHFEIPADDPEQLTSFYRDLFGWQVTKWGSDGMDYWMVQTVETDDQGMPQQPGAINGGVFRRQAPEQRPINYISVESVDEHIAKAKALGATVSIEKMAVPSMGWFAQFVDPQGNPFAIWQDDRSAS